MDQPAQSPLVNKLPLPLVLLLGCSTAQAPAVKPAAGVGPGAPIASAGSASPAAPTASAVPAASATSGVPAASAASAAPAGLAALAAKAARAAPPETLERLTSDAPRATASGATFTGPAGW